MESVLVVAMIALGIGIALAVLLSVAMMKRLEAEREISSNSVKVAPDFIASSILFHIALRGGASSQQAARVVRDAGLAAQLVESIDLYQWALRYASATDEAARLSLLELGVKTAVGMNSVIPLPQYDALLDLSFGLGFQTDALARLRARYRFDYVDHAKVGRPRDADRAGGAAPLFVRSEVDITQELKVLGLEGEVDRSQLVTAYRRLAAQNHPDRFHSADPEEQNRAAARFIEITEAYEHLMRVFRD